MVTWFKVENEVKSYATAANCSDKALATAYKQVI